MGHKSVLENPLFNHSQILKQQTKAYLCLLLGVFCIAWSAIFVKMAHAPALTSGFYRYFFCFIGLVPIWLYKGVKVPSNKTLAWIALGGLLFVLDMSFWNLSIVRTSAGVSTLLANNASVFVGLGALFFFKQTLSRRYWIGLAVSMLGVFIVAGKDLLQNQSVGVGHLMAITAAVFYAGYMLVTQKVRGTIDTVNFMAWSLIPCLVLSWSICKVQGLELIEFDTQTWWAFVGMGIICHLLGWLSINYALGHIPASVVSPTLLLQPVLTAFISFVLLNETLRAEQIAGGFIVMMGIYLVNKRS